MEALCLLKGNPSLGAGLPADSKPQNWADAHTRVGLTTQAHWVRRAPRGQAEQGFSTAWIGGSLRGQGVGRGGGGGGRARHGGKPSSREPEEYEEVLVSTPP